ncbi:MAG: ADP-ribosylglycohydrolase family protein [Chloroflexota bacterium]|nr:ADP-ribosylglycohydrolase family protein [Chloroflexota bacterium]
MNLPSTAPTGYRATEDKFLGCLLGLAIGDALGMPVEGWSRERIVETFGRLDGYHPRVFPDGAEIKAGEFTDESEFALSIVESLTTNRGALDPDNIGARLLFLLRGESRRWMSADTLATLAEAETSRHFTVALDEDGPATGDVATRGVPIGLLYAVGRFDDAGLRYDAERVTRLTHGSPAAIAGTTAVAYGVNLAVRGDLPPDRWAEETAHFLGGGELADALARVGELRADATPVGQAISALGNGNPARESVAAGFYAAMTAEVFEDAVFAAINAGGDTDTIGAIAGALAGAAHGASGISQPLIDDLEGRIYVSLAAPWYYRTALQKAGLIIDLRAEGDQPPPRPSAPPRV